MLKQRVITALVLLALLLPALFYSRPEALAVLTLVLILVLVLVLVLILFGVCD